MANPQLDAIRDEVAALRRLRFEELGTTSIPIYAGDIENLGIYLDRFDVISVAYGWTEEEKCQRFPLYLRDHALDVYRAITQARRAVFNDMLTDFRNGISTTDAPKMFGCQLRARKQRHDESSAMFASKLKKLARQAYPALTEAQLDLFHIWSTKQSSKSFVRQRYQHFCRCYSISNQSGNALEIHSANRLLYSSNNHGSTSHI
jgi:hypothetical protein